MRIKKCINFYCLDTAVPLNYQKSHYKKCIVSCKENYNFAPMTKKVHQTGLVFIFLHSGTWLS